MPSNYPPGVSGNEYEIAGADYQREYTDKDFCPKCLMGGTLYQEGYQSQHWVFCSECGYERELEGDKNDA